MSKRVNLSQTRRGVKLNEKKGAPMTGTYDLCSLNNTIPHTQWSEHTGLNLDLDFFLKSQKAQMHFFSSSKFLVSFGGFPGLLRFSLVESIEKTGMVFFSS